MQSLQEIHQQGELSGAPADSSLEREGSGSSPRSGAENILDRIIDQIPQNRTCSLLY